MSILKENVRLTVGGAVQLGNMGYCHPEFIRDMFGEEGYQELLSRPRVVCEYDTIDENGNLVEDGEEP